MRRHHTDTGRHDVGSYIECNGFSVQNDATLVVVNAVLFEFDKYRSFVVDVDPRIEHSECCSAIGCPGIEIRETKDRCDGSRNRALANTAWAIDGYDHNPSNVS
jgi:hypothetical protein